MERTNDSDGESPDRAETPAGEAAARPDHPAEADERAERQLDEAKERLSKTLEGDLNVTLGE